jgi:hypothetical protein
LEQVEEIGLAGGAAPDKEVSEDPTARPKAAVRKIARRAPWVVPSLVIHFVFLMVFVATAYVVTNRLEALDVQSRSQAAEIAAVSKKTEELATETAGLKTESQNLRQSLMSSMSEDVIFLKVLILKPDIEPKLAREIARAIHRYCQMYERDANLVLAIIEVESNFNPKAVSHMGALGLMQVMPQWKKVLGIDGNLADVETSIKYGLQVLGFYLEMYKDLELALTAYNRGPGPVDFALMRQQDPKNKYAPRVLAEYEKLKKLSVSVDSGLARL